MITWWNISWIRSLITSKSKRADGEKTERGRWRTCSSSEDKCACVCVCVCVKRCEDLPETLTDEEDGKGDEEQEHMWHHVEGIQETAVVQNPPVHVVGHRVILVPTERQGHGGTWTLQGTGRRKRRKKEGGRRRRRRQRTDRQILNRGTQRMSCSRKERWWRPQSILVIP